jgi:hypothetical protein
MPAAQTKPESWQLRSPLRSAQHGCPGPPQPQLPFWHVKALPPSLFPMPQAVPEATQPPAIQHPPAVQLSPGQHGCPGAPHAQVPLVQGRKAVIGSHAYPSQHACPAPPHCTQLLVAVSQPRSA